MLLTDLVVSQNEVRHDAAHLHQMIEFVKSDGFFTAKSIQAWNNIHGGRSCPPLIGLTRFPDNFLLLHDGHNRAISILLGGRDYIHESEYFVKDYDYWQYTKLEPHNNWFTPFDPKTTLRRAEFGEYKFQAKAMWKREPEQLSQWVEENRYLYSVPRDLRTVAELAERVCARLDRKYCDGNPD